MLPPSSAWVSREVAGRGIDGAAEVLSLREPREDAGRLPYPMVEEKVALFGRAVVEPVRDIVDEAYEWPRACAFGAPAGGRVMDPGRLVSCWLVGLGRVAGESISVSLLMGIDNAQFVRETLVALLAMDPGGRMPERELVVAEVISRRPACGMRDRVEARGRTLRALVSLKHLRWNADVIVYHVLVLHAGIGDSPGHRRV